MNLNNFLFSSECSKIIEIATKESKYLKPNDEAVDFHIPIIAKFWRKHIIINIPKRKLLFLKSNKTPIMKPDKTIGLNQRIPNFEKIQKF